MGEVGKQILDMQKKIDDLMRENKELKKHQYISNEITFSINDHGAVAIHGLGKYPIQLFADQIFQFLDKETDLRKFIDDNKDDLSWRNKRH
jgi:hypothetical protein